MIMNQFIKGEMDKDLSGTHSRVKIFKRKGWVTVRCCIRKNQEEDAEGLINLEVMKPRGQEEKGFR